MKTVTKSLQAVFLGRMRLEKVMDEIPDEPLKDGELLWHLYRERDWSQRTIAFELGEPKGKVLKALIQHNVLQPWTDKETLQQALESGKTPEQISEEWGCSTVTIYRWLDEHDIKRRAKLTGGLLHELYKVQQLTCEEIGEDLGYSPVKVHFALVEYGIKTRDGTHRFR